MHKPTVEYLGYEDIGDSVKSVSDHVDKSDKVIQEPAQLVNMKIHASIIRSAKAAGRFIRIDRQSKWGNPFIIGVDGTREEVVDKYEKYIRNNTVLMNSIEELLGKVLGCWCFPKLCHGHVLIKILKERLCQV